MVRRESSRLNEIRDVVREQYASAARQVGERGESASCGENGGGCCQTSGAGIALADYDPAELSALPGDAVLASLGCGNPTALAELKPGDMVLDLGSGGGIDVLLSARRVAPDGVAYGLDMTDEMLALAERNRAKAGIENARFIKGTIEDIPLPDGSVDTIISNCVINLSGDKDQVLREAFRVLRPGGRFAVSDIIIQGQLSADVRESLAAWAACVAGALRGDEFRERLESAGFVDVRIEITNVHGLSDLAGDNSCCGDLQGCGCQGDRSGEVASAFIRARKPEGSDARQS